jgi:hypothetical protein
LKGYFVVFWCIWVIIVVVVMRVVRIIRVFRVIKVIRVVSVIVFRFTWIVFLGFRVDILIKVERAFRHTVGLLGVY